MSKINLDDLKSNKNELDVTNKILLIIMYSRRWDIGKEITSKSNKFAIFSERRSISCYILINLDRECL